MGSASRLLCTVLAVLLVFAGGTLDLCACDATAHGAFCASAGAEAVAACHAEPAPAPAESKHACCAAAASAPLSDETLTAAGCGCPVIVVEQPPSESPVTSTAGFDRTSELCSVDAALSDTWLAPEADEPQGEPWRDPPRVPALRRHLSLHVLRH